VIAVEVLPVTAMGRANLQLLAAMLVQLYQQQNLLQKHQWHHYSKYLQLALPKH
jgi:hypothetical protein